MSSGSRSISNVSIWWNARRKKPSVKDYTNNLPYLLYGFLASRLSRLFVGDEKQDFDNGKRQTLLAAEKAKKNKLSISVRWIEKATRDPRDQNHENRVFTLENSQQSPSTSTSLSAHSLAILTKQISLISREWNWESKRQWPTKTPQRDKRLIIKMKTMLLLSFSLPSLACLRKTFYAIIGKRKTLWWMLTTTYIQRSRRVQTKEWRSKLFSEVHYKFPFYRLNWIFISEKDSSKEAALLPAFLFLRATRRCWLLFRSFTGICGRAIEFLFETKIDSFTL